MKDLIDMVSYVLKLEFEDLELKEKQTIWQEYFNKTSTYARLLNTYLALGQFIPCDLDGNILEKPKEFDKGYYLEDNAIFKYNHLWVSRCIEYQQALDRVIFEGFKFEDDLKMSHYYFKTEKTYFSVNRHSLYFFNDSKRILKINDLVNNGLKIKI